MCAFLAITRKIKIFGSVQLQLYSFSNVHRCKYVLSVQKFLIVLNHHVPYATPLLYVFAPQLSDCSKFIVVTPRVLHFIPLFLFQHSVRRVFSTQRATCLAVTSVHFLISV